MQTLEQYRAEQKERFAGIGRLPRLDPEGFQVLGAAQNVVAERTANRNGSGEGLEPETATDRFTGQKTRIRHAAGQMNGMEKRYAIYLDIQKACGEVLRWRFEPLKLKLAPATFWTPDFELVMPDGKIELHETKGHWEDDARVKIKIAAQMFPEFRIVAVTHDRRSKTWNFEVFA